MSEVEPLGGQSGNVNGKRYTMLRTKQTGGGAATATGIDFQHRVAAWAAVRILADRATTPQWDLPVDTTLEWLRCEAAQPVDDLLLGTSRGGCIFAQVKHTVDGSKAPGSSLASALEQFVRQVAASRVTSPGDPTWKHPLDHRDRLVLAIGPTSSSLLRVDLPVVLRRVRSLPEDHGLEEAVTTQSERRILAIVTEHVRRVWQAALATTPGDGEVRTLLSRVYVQVLNVEVGGLAEREALQLLRTAVLVDPTQDATAWSVLIKVCAGLAAERAAVDRAGLQRILERDGVAVRPGGSYQRDITRLRDHTRAFIGAVAHLAEIRVNAVDVPLRIDREVTEAIRQAAENAHLLIVGEPGIGKSGALHDAVHAMSQEVRDVVFLPVDRLAARSLMEMQNELRLDHPLEDVLANWPGADPAFLVVDALDAAREEVAARAVRDLIRNVVRTGGRWHVVASIRRFDLRYSPELQALFTGKPPSEFRDPAEFSGVCHISVPAFSHEEMEAITSQSAALQQVVTNAPGQLHALLRIPFNLRLLAELVGEDVPESDLTRVGTQLELLDKYWSYRVVGGDDIFQGDAREAVLRRACEEMLRTRSLQADRGSVVDAVTSLALNDILRRHVLVEWQASSKTRPTRSSLAFAHNVLFDFAVAQLVLRGNTVSIVARLEADPELVLAARPSLAFHFAYLWQNDRDAFWDLLLAVIRSEEIRQVGKLIGPSIAAEYARCASDVEILCNMLDAGDEAARLAIGHLTGSVLSREKQGEPISGRTAGPWCDLVERLTRGLGAGHANAMSAIRPLLLTLCEHPEVFTSEQRVAVGKAARRLLAFTWQCEQRDPWLVRCAIEAVCRTVESDPHESVDLLRKILDAKRLEDYDYIELPALAGELVYLTPYAPAFVRHVYEVAFSHEPACPDTSTAMLPSRLMPLTSHRGQDYDMGLYQLAEVYPKFLAASPEEATRALIAVLEAYVARSIGSLLLDPESFEFWERQAGISTDYGRVWELTDARGHDEEMKMLQAFEGHLEKLADQECEVGVLARIVDVVVASNRLAVLWGRLLRVGSRYPHTLGKLIRPLAWARPILARDDTVWFAGDYLTAIYSSLSEEERARVEATVLSLADDEDEEGKSRLPRLLAGLPEGLLVSEGARRAQLKVADAGVSVQSTSRPGFWIRPIGEEDWPQAERAPSDSPEDGRFRDLARPVQEFARKHLNSTPGADEAAAVYPALKELHTALGTGQVPIGHCDAAWDALVGACVRLARMDDLTVDATAGDFVRSVLLEGSHYVSPVLDHTYGAHFDESPSWGTPAPRVGAAEGLMTLARHAALLNDAVLEAIEHLSRDPVPPVRFQIAAHLWYLNKTSTDAMWRILDRICAEEASNGVLQALFFGSFGRLAHVDCDRVSANIIKILGRAAAGPGAGVVREHCVGLIADLYLWRDQAACHGVLLKLADDPAGSARELRKVMFRVREFLVVGPTQPPDSAKDAMRWRAFTLVRAILALACTAMTSLEEAHVGLSFNQRSEDNQRDWRSVAELIDAIGLELYFASGAFDGKRQGSERALTDVEKRRFYQESRDIVEMLSGVGLPTVAHHLLEMIETFVAFDPPGVFKCIGRVLRGGETGGYQYEVSAVNVVVRLVERYLAEYRSIFREDQECRQVLLDILDLFVNVGWPLARQLAYRLEEIYR